MNTPLRLFLLTSILSLLSLPSALGFSLYSTKFDNSQPIPYYINLGAFDKAANRADLIKGIRNAFQHVEDNPHIQVTFQYMGETTLMPELDTLNIVYLDSDGTYVPGAGVMFNYNADYTTGRAISADIALNGNSHGSAPLTNLYALTLHELCHLLGLGHSPVGTTSAVAENTVQMALSQDDIAGLATLYPNPARPLGADFGTVRGRVLDSTGAGFPARIVAYNLSLAHPRVVTADCASDGRYELPGLPAGTYNIVAETDYTPFLHCHTQQGVSQVVVAGTLLEGRDVNPVSYGPARLNTSSMEEVAIHPVTGHIYSSNLYGPLYVLDPVTGARLATLPIRADDLAFTANGSKLVVVSQLDRKVSVVDTVAGSPTRHTVISQVSNTPSQPTGVAVRGNETAYASCNGGRCVLVVDLATTTLTATIMTNEYNQDISISPDGTRAMLGTYYGGINNWLEINIVPGSPTVNTIVRKFSAGSNGAWRVIAAADGERVFIGTRDGVDVRRRSDNALLKQISGGRGTLTTLELTPSGRHLAYVGWDNDELRNNQLKLIDTTTLAEVDQVTLGGDFHYVGDGPTSSSFLVSGDSGLHLVRPAALAPDSLVALTLSQGTLSPAFASSVMDYTTQLPHNTTAIRLTPVAAEDGASITINGLAAISGQAGPEIGLQPGDNVIQIRVTPPGGGQARTYAVNARRSPAPLMVLEGTDNSPVTKGSVREFDATALNESRTMTFTLRNDGMGDLEDISLALTGADAGQFQLPSQVPATLAPSGTTQFAVLFRPASPGAKAALLSIESNDGSAPLTLNLVGTGVRAQPLVTTLPANDLRTSSAVLHGSVDAGGVDRHVVFDVGLTTNLDLTVNATPYAVSGSAATAVSALVGQLLPHTRYYYRARAFSELGYSTGATLSFVTANTPPVAMPDSATVVPGASVILKPLLNDEDPDGDSFSLHTFTAVSPAGAGSLGRSGNELVFTASSSFTGAVIDYVIKDALGAVSASSRVTLTPGSLEIDPVTMSVPATGLDYAVNITSDSSWTAVENLSWATVSPLSGEGSGSIQVTVLPNSGKTVRQGSLFIGGREHRISQETAPRPELSYPAEIPAAMIAADYELEIPTTGLPVTYTVTNLPPGLRLDGVTGLLSGRPTKAGSYRMRISAANGAGSSSTTLDITVQVTSLAEELTGTYHGFVARDETLNMNLGSRLELTTSGTGTLSGKLVTGVTARPFSGSLQIAASDPGFARAHISLSAPSRPTLELDLLFDQENRSLSGTLTDSTGLSTGVEGWKNTWNPKNKVPAYYRKLHTFALEPGSDDPAVPQGHGFGSFSTVAESSGLISLAGRLADGGTFTTGTHLGRQGQVLVYQPLYANRGSLAGVLLVTPHDDGLADNGISGMPTWFKPAPSAATRETLYASGFGPLTLLAHGGAYPVIPKGGLILDLTPGADTASLAFTLGGLDMEGLEFSQALRVTNPSATGTTNKLTPVLPLLNSVKVISLNALTGAFSGEFTLPGATAALKRKATFQGQIVNGMNGLEGLGHFILPQGNTSSSARLSGRVRLTPAE